MKLKGLDELHLPPPSTLFALAHVVLGVQIAFEPSGKFRNPNLASFHVTTAHFIQGRAQISFSRSPRELGQIGCLFLFDDILGVDRMEGR
jgi:hypothetical protein